MSADLQLRPCGHCGGYLGFLASGQACPRCGTLPDPDDAALAILHRDLTPGLRDALAHLLNNALTPVAMGMGFPDAEVSLPDLREAVRNLLDVVSRVLA